MSNCVWQWLFNKDTSSNHIQTPERLHLVQQSDSDSSVFTSRDKRFVLNRHNRHSKAWESVRRVLLCEVVSMWMSKHSADSQMSSLFRVIKSKPENIELVSSRWFLINSIDCHRHTLAIRIWGTGTFCRMTHICFSRNFRVIDPTNRVICLVVWDDEGVRLSDSPINVQTIKCLLNWSTVDLASSWEQHCSSSGDLSTWAFSFIAIDKRHPYRYFGMNGRSTTQSIHDTCRQNLSISCWYAIRSCKKDQKSSTITSGRYLNSLH